MTDKRLLILVVGPGRSGTSLVAGMLRAIGYRVPQPEFASTAANPRGYSESVWVYRFHENLLLDAGIAYLADHYPDQFMRCHRISRAPGAAALLRDFLSEQFEATPHLLIKDPRTVFFAPAWLRAARELRADVRFVCMVRDPVEVIGSQNHYYRPPYDDDARLIAWIYAALQAERVTRHHERRFVAFDELARWPAIAFGPVLEICPALPGVETAQAVTFAEPELHRIKGTDSGKIYTTTHELAQRVRQLLLTLARSPNGHDREVHRLLEQQRERLGIL